MIKRIFLVLVLGLILRLFLINLGFHTDLLSIAGWGEWIYKHGFRNFYENSVWVYSWPTQPPLANIIYTAAFYIYQQAVWLFSHIAWVIAVYHLAPGHLIWWFDFVKWFGTALFRDTSFPTGFILTIKFIAILADLGLSVIIYKIARRINPKTSIFYALAFLFLPFSWYLSSLWGQYDQLGYLFLLGAFLLLIGETRNFILKRTLFLAPILLAVSVGIKPTSVIFVPIFFYIYILNKPKIWELVVGLGLALGVTLLSLVLFTDQNLWQFINSTLIPKVIFKSEFRVSVNALNFWHLLVGFKAMGQDSQLLFIQAKIWGYAVFIILNLISFSIIKHEKDRYKATFFSMFMIGMGSWLFLTNMLERYLFAGITSGLFVTIYYPRLFRYWVVLSLIFWINMYRDFKFPSSIGFFNEILIWNGGIALRILSLINIIFFIKISHGFLEGRVRNLIPGGSHIKINLKRKTDI